MENQWERYGFMETYVENHYLVGGFKHEFYFPSYMGCHPSHWRTHIFQRGWNPQPGIISYYRKPKLWPMDLMFWWGTLEKKHGTNLMSFDVFVATLSSYCWYVCNYINYIYIYINYIYIIIVYIYICMREQLQCEAPSLTLPISCR